MCYSTCAAARIVIEDEVIFAFGFAILMQQERRCIQVKIIAPAVPVCIPTQPYYNFRQTRIGLGQINPLSFGKTDCHWLNPLSCFIAARSRG
ncbi:hypothetical protein D3C76_1624370 [compost metagenome]